ncbi:hypothetical protein DPX16_22311 [Anabarilius grahami]|uniref:Uncharacterized protein n=1 Tax=Anabarilius grahami TaxID=495550 RepID=A0A3N0YVI8_ANAGA|nr:hypothetical protein DPX16_22311 [Anabarilius grahami]
MVFIILWINDAPIEKSSNGGHYGWQRQAKRVHAHRRCTDPRPLSLTQSRATPPVTHSEQSHASCHSLRAAAGLETLVRSG